MLTTEGGQGNGLLWFGKGTHVADVARIMSTALRVPMLPHGEVLAIARCANPSSYAGGASGIVRVLSTRVTQSPICSTEEDARAVLRIACSALSDHKAREEFKSRLSRIDSFVDC
jgi:dTDP-4-dehydrorhamnose reductase